MKSWIPALTIFLVSTMLSPPLSVVAQPQNIPDRDDLPREMLHPLTLSWMGRSGLRALLSTSGSLGDLQNRSASYMMATRLEESRSGPLVGLISGLQDALDNPNLSSHSRASLHRRLEHAYAELHAVPSYVANYQTVTSQAEALLPLGFVAQNPVFLLVRLRGHMRWGGQDGLTVVTEGVSVGPMFVGFDRRWILSPGLNVGRTDVDIQPFDGHSEALSVGPRLSFGAILNSRWSMAVESAHAWIYTDSRVEQPGHNGTTTVRKKDWSRTTTAKIEIQGHFPIRAAGEAWSISPRAGAFLISTQERRENNPTIVRKDAGNSSHTDVAAARTSIDVSRTFGKWIPDIHFGLERELNKPSQRLIYDPTAIRAGAGISWTWARGRRVSLNYSHLQGLKGDRSISDLTVVLLVDG